MCAASAGCAELNTACRPTPLHLQDFVAPALQQSGNYEAALHAAFHAADNEVLNVCRSTPLQDGNVSGAGATATVVVVKPNEVITANLGDSSAVLQRKGRQISLSKEHRVYGKCAPPCTPHSSCSMQPAMRHLLDSIWSSRGSVS